MTDVHWIDPARELVMLEEELRGYQQRLADLDRTEATSEQGLRFRRELRDEIERVTREIALVAEELELW